MNNHKPIPAPNKNPIPLSPVCYGQLVANTPALITSHLPMTMGRHPQLVNMWSCPLCGLQATFKVESKNGSG